jgi:3-deoxy-D-manno-octulosonate 8-phosphate phosphatase (KDO 8-P phosphatase)
VPRPRRAATHPVIRLLVLDVDGVLTDGRLYFGADGEALKVFHVRDGLGIKLAQRADIAVAVVSGRSSPAVANRCRELDIVHVVQACDDKLSAVSRIARELGIEAQSIACVVDDTSDLPLVSAVGLAFAVSDAHAEVRRAAHRVTRLAGGRGAVREVCDWLLENTRRNSPKNGHKRRISKS